MTVKPKRRFMLKLNIGADSMDDIRRSLEDAIITLYKVEDRDWSSVLGGPSAGFSLDVEFNPDVTHESYHEQLKAYLAEQKASDR